MQSPKSVTARIIDHGILILGTVFLMLPVVALVATSTHTSSEISEQGIQFFPGAAMAQNYAQVFDLEAGFTDQITVAAMLRNSLVIALGVACLTTAVSFLAAFALVYFRLPLAGFLFWLTMTTLLLPLESRFVTTFQVAAALGLVNTHIGMVLPVLAIALGTLFFRAQMRGLAEELLEAAKLDGAGPVKFMLDIVLPLSARRCGAIFVVSFMIGWHQYMWPLMMSTDETRYTAVRGIGLVGLESGPGMALAVLTLIPPLILVLIFQRWFFASLSEAGNAE